MNEEILAKAAEMFLTLGVKSVTMDEIAARLGISKKTIYAHYSTKSKLVEATAFYVFETITTGIQEIKDEKKDPIEELFAIKDFASVHLKDEKSSPQYQLKKYYPKIYSTVKDKQRELLEKLTTENLQKGIDTGFYREDLPIPFISRIYFVGILSIKDLDLFPENEFPQNLTEMHLEYHLRSIVTPKGQKRLENLLTTTEAK